MTAIAAMAPRPKVGTVRSQMSDHKGVRIVFGASPRYDRCARSFFRAICVAAVIFWSDQ
ncbi:MULTISPECIES: hypothetical protein [Rhizobium]|uniref:hypothetical protein n=1 Tax=Rhizobium phaseoli TaxID=396 RepID=UPI0001904A90|nr:hypothetical protein [Rhizobium phaseoli]